MAIRKIISRSIGVDVIAAEDLAAGSVQTAEIQNGAVTGPKLADNLNYDSGTLYLDSTNNRVGIGTTSPSAKLQVEGILSVRSSSSQIFNDSANANNLTMNDSKVHFNVDGTDKDFQVSSDTITNALFVQGSSGNVGIGTASPSEALHVTGTGGAGVFISSAGSTNGGVLRLQNTTSSNYDWRFAVGGGDNVYVNGRGFFIRDDTAGATRLVIEENGNVGIGTTSPGIYKLLTASTNAGNSFAVHGTTGNIVATSQGNAANATNLQTTENHIKFTSYFDNGGKPWNQGNQLFLSNSHYASGTPHTRILLNTSQGGYNNGGMIHAEGAGGYNAGQLVFSIGWDTDNIPDEIYRISSGRMLIGTGSNNLPSASVAGAAFNLQNNSELMCSVAGTGNSTQIRFLNPNGEVGAIRTNGTATSYITSSDYRLKENITTDWDATTRLKQLNPVRFNFISDADTTVDGFLAHEVQDIVPESISGIKDGMVDEEYEVTPAVDATWDEDGNVLTEAVPAVMATRQVPEYQGIDQSKLVPLLVKSLQEALTEIDSLKARLNDAGL